MPFTQQSYELPNTQELTRLQTETHLTAYHTVSALDLNTSLACYTYFYDSHTILMTIHEWRKETCPDPEFDLLYNPNI